jgi:hypothetical protein
LVGQPGVATCIGKRSLDPEVAEYGGGPWGEEPDHLVDPVIRIAAVDDEEVVRRLCGQNLLPRAVENCDVVVLREQARDPRRELRVGLRREERCLRRQYPLNRARRRRDRSW